MRRFHSGLLPFMVPKPKGFPYHGKGFSYRLVSHDPKGYYSEMKHVTRRKKLPGYHQESDKLSVAYLMARRLAASLESTGIEQLANDFGHEQDMPLGEDTVHPMFFYIIPPIEGKIHTGALYRDANGKHRVVLSNACDLELRPLKKIPRSPFARPTTCCWRNVFLSLNKTNTFS